MYQILNKPFIFNVHGNDKTAPQSQTIVTEDYIARSQIKDRNVSSYFCVDPLLVSKTGGQTQMI